MRCSYYKDIYEVLRPCGASGLPLSQIARYVYNRRASFFCPDLTYSRVYDQVAHFLWRQSSRPKSKFQKAPSYGCYRIKDGVYRQLHFRFEPSHAKSEAKALPPKRKGKQQPTLFVEDTATTCL